MSAYPAHLGAMHVEPGYAQPRRVGPTGLAEVSVPAGVSPCQRPNGNKCSTESQHMHEIDDQRYQEALERQRPRRQVPA